MCGSGNSVNDNDDNVNIGSNEDVEDSALMRFREQSQEKSNNNLLLKSKNSQGSVKNSMVFSNNQSITSSRHLKEVLASANSCIPTSKNLKRSISGENAHKMRNQLSKSKNSNGSFNGSSDPRKLLRGSTSSGGFGMKGTSFLQGSHILSQNGTSIDRMNSTQQNLGSMLGNLQI